MLAARHSWPFSLARCSDEVGGFNDGYDVFDWFPVRARDMRPWRGLVTDPRSHPPRSPVFLLRRRFAIPVEALEDRSLDSLARLFFRPHGQFFIKAWSTSPATPYAGPTVTPDQEGFYGLVDPSTGHPSPVPCLAHLTLTTVWGVRPGSGHLGAGVHSEGPLTARYSPREDVVYLVDGPGECDYRDTCKPSLPGRLVSDRANRGK